MGAYGWPFLTPLIRGGIFPPMPKRQRPPKSARPGWGRAINFRLRTDADAVLEAAREHTGLDRSAYVRMAVIERSRADVARRARSDGNT